MNPAAHPEEKLLDLAYGELPPPEASAVQLHLAGCALCTRKLAGIQEVRRAMAALEPSPPPAEGVESLLAYAQQAVERRRAPTPSRARRWLLAATALVVASVVVVVASGPSAQRSGAPVPGGGMPNDAVALAPVAPAPSLANRSSDPKGSGGLPENDEAPLLAERGSALKSRIRPESADTVTGDAYASPPPPPSPRPTGAVAKPPALQRSSGVGGAQKKTRASAASELDDEVDGEDELQRGRSVAAASVPAPAAAAPAKAAPASAPGNLAANTVRRQQREQDTAAQSRDRASDDASAFAKEGDRGGADVGRLEALCLRPPSSSVLGASSDACRILLRRFPTSRQAAAARAMLNARADAGVPSPP